MTEPLDPEAKRLRKLKPGELADEALALKKRIDSIREEAIRRGVTRAEGLAGRITLTPPGKQERSDRDPLLQVLGISAAEFVSRFCHTVETDWQMRIYPRKTGRDRAAAA